METADREQEDMVPLMTAKEVARALKVAFSSETFYPADGGRCAETRTWGIS